MTFEYSFVDARAVKKLMFLLKPALVKAGIKDLFKENSVTIGE